MYRYNLRYAPAVAGELQASFPSGREFWRLVGEHTLAEIVPGPDRIIEFGPGERAAITVALEHRDWVLLLDDQRPFQAAARLGLSVICTPVLAVGFFSDGTLMAGETLTVLGRLAAMQTVSPHLLAMALAQLGRALAQQGRI